MLKAPQLRPIEILLAEDSSGDVALTKLAFMDSKVSNNVYVVSDGVQVMQFLYRQPPYALVPRPDLILLDLNMPRKNGLETLADLRADPELRSIPVIILTVSQAEKDVVESYLQQANCYIVKPVELDDFVEIVKSIESFWFSIVTLPSANRT